MTTQINQLTELTTTSDGDLLLIRENATGVDKKMQASNLRAKATTKGDVGLGDVDNVSAASLRDRSTHTGTQPLSTISDSGTMASQNANSVNIDGGTIDGTAVNATNLAYTGTLTGGTGVVNLGSGQVVKDASGNVGIGTATPEARLSFSVPLFNDSQQKAVIRFQNPLNNHDAYIQSFNTTGDGSNLLFGSNFLLSNAGGFVAPDATSPSCGINIDRRGFIDIHSGSSGSPAERMRIDSSGNVGIGTTAPATDLHINSTAGPNVTIGSSNFDQTSTIKLLEGTSTAAPSGGYVRYNGGTNLFFIGGQDTDDTERDVIEFPRDGSRLSFDTNNIERMRIDSSGNLLIGTTTSLGARLVLDNQSSTTQTLIISRDSGGSGTHTHIEFQNTNGAVGSITTASSATSYNTSSDYRLKENIQPLTGALDKVQAMNPVTYDWKAGGEGEGFIAHELQEIAPYAVNGEKDGEDMQGVDYGKLTTLLVGAVKELTAEVEQLKAQLGANNGN